MPNKVHWDLANFHTGTSFRSSPPTHFLSYEMMDGIVHPNTNRLKLVSIALAMSTAALINRVNYTQ